MWWWWSIFPTLLSAGAFKQAFASDPTAPISDSNPDTPIHFEVMSAGSPYIAGVNAGEDGTMYNEEVTAPHMHDSVVSLTIRDDTFEEIKDIDDRFQRSQ